MKRTNLQTTITLSLLLGISLLSLTGCQNFPGSAEPETKIQSPAEESPIELTLLTTPEISGDGLEAVLALAEEKLNIRIQLEYRASGEEGENMMKTRLASGNMTDLCSFGGGSMLKSLYPEEYFVNLSEEEYIARLDGSFLDAMTIDGSVYGVPDGYVNSVGAILYNKDIYDQYQLSIPDTWEQFLDNCEILKNAGKTAVIGAFAEEWSSQILFLADYYNVQAEIPDFASQFESGQIQYRELPIARRSWEKLEEVRPYCNPDAFSLNSHEACRMLLSGEGAHYIFLTSRALNDFYEQFQEQTYDLPIGFFPIPGDDPNQQGITVWPANGIMVNKYSEHLEEALEFLRFYMSEEAIGTYFQAVPPSGPLAVQTDSVVSIPPIVLEEQEYIQTGRYSTALEFQTALKGNNCINLCKSVLEGSLTGREAAEKYDLDCMQKALEMGLDWEWGS